MPLPRPEASPSPRTETATCVPCPVSTSRAPSFTIDWKQQPVAARPVEDGGDPARGDVGVGRRRRAAAEAGVGHGHRLGRAVVARCLRGGGAHDHAAAVLVVLLAQDEVLDPRDVPRPARASSRSAVAEHDDVSPLAAQRPARPCRRSTSRPRRRRCPARAVRCRAVPRRASGAGSACRPGGRSPTHRTLARRRTASACAGVMRTLNAKSGMYSSELAAGGRDGRLPGVLDRAHELDDVGAALGGPEAPGGAARPPGRARRATDRRWPPSGGSAARPGRFAGRRRPAARCRGLRP